MVRPVSSGKRLQRLFHIHQHGVRRHGLLHSGLGVGDAGGRLVDGRLLAGTGEDGAVAGRIGSEAADHLGLELLEPLAGLGAEGEYGVKGQREGRLGAGPPCCEWR